MSPAKSKAQHGAAGAALAAKRGKMPMSELKGPAKQMAKEMTQTQLTHMTKTHVKGLPKHKGKRK